MLTSADRLFTLNLDRGSAPGLRRSASFVWTGWFLAILALTGLCGLVLMRGVEPNPALIGWLLYLAGAVAILAQPRWGIYLVVPLALAGDRTLTPWYPFLTNFSSRESLFFIGDRLIFNPCEVYIVLAYLSWLVGAAVLRKGKFFKAGLLWPALLFTGFISFGAVYGIGKGGSLNTVLWEIRPIFYLPALLILASNLLTKREHVSRLMWLIMTALFVKGVLGTWFVFFVLHGDLQRVQEITEHAAAIQIDSFLVFALAVWFFKSPWAYRILLPLMSIPVLITYVATQRRSAFIALFFVLVLFAFILYREKRALFWTIIPAVVLVSAAYTALFWNNQGALGMPIRAIKSQIAPSQVSVRDQSSDQYRLIENYDLYVTIRRSPVTGTGFGQPFVMAIPLPDISFFIWWRYITHNSILWIWANTGIGGFLSLLLLIGTSIGSGVRVMLRAPDGIYKAVALSAAMYLVMHFTYAYVDMSWDNASMIYIGTMMGLIGCLEAVLAQPFPIPTRRWPWLKSDATPIRTS